MDKGRHVKYPLLLSYLTKISNFIKIRPMAAEMFHVDGQADMTKLTVAFRNFANASKYSTL
jgi:hypothetical protein